MWTCRLQEVRERRGRWQIEGVIEHEGSEGMPFSVTVRFGWLALEGVSGPLFTRVLEHFSQVLGEPKEPPTCAGASECQDDAVHLTTSWELQEQGDTVAPLLERLLKIALKET